MAVPSGIPRDPHLPVRLRRALDRLASMDPVLLGALGSTGRWFKRACTYTDFSAPAMTSTLPVYTLAAKELLDFAIIDITTTFSGGAIGTYTLTLMGPGPLLGPRDAMTLGNSLGNVSVFKSAATTTLSLKADSTVANLNAATQGALTLWLRTSVLP